MSRHRMYHHKNHIDYRNATAGENICEILKQNERLHILHNKNFHSSLQNKSNIMKFILFMKYGMNKWKLYKNPKVFINYEHAHMKMNI